MKLSLANVKAVLFFLYQLFDSNSFQKGGMISLKILFQNYFNIS